MVAQDMEQRSQKIMYIQALGGTQVLTVLEGGTNILTEDCLFIMVYTPLRGNVDIATEYEV